MTIQQYNFSKELVKHDFWQEWTIFQWTADKKIGDTRWHTVHLWQICCNWRRFISCCFSGLTYSHDFHQEMDLNNFKTSKWKLIFTRFNKMLKIGRKSNNRI